MKILRLSVKNLKYIISFTNVFIILLLLLSIVKFIYGESVDMGYINFYLLINLFGRIMLELRWKK